MAVISFNENTLMTKEEVVKISGNVGSDVINFCYKCIPLLNIKFSSIPDLIIYVISIAYTAGRLQAYRECRMHKE